MQDKQFITEPRRGCFRKDQHCLLMSWAYDCSWHVLPSFGKTIDECLHHAWKETTAWKEGEATVGKDREASARELVLTARRIKKTSYNDYQEII